MSETDDIPDYAELIAQYEATEHDLINSLDSTAGNSTVKSNLTGFERKNVPDVDSNSDSEHAEDGDQQSQTSHMANDDDEATDYFDDEDQSQTSYTEDTGNQDHNDDDDDDDDETSAAEEYESDINYERGEDDSSQRIYTEDETHEEPFEWESYESDNNGDDDDYEIDGGDDHSQTSYIQDRGYRDDGNEDDYESDTNEGDEYESDTNHDDDNVSASFQHEDDDNSVPNQSQDKSEDGGKFSPMASMPDRRRNAPDMDDSDDGEIWGDNNSNDSGSHTSYTEDGTASFHGKPDPIGSVDSDASNGEAPPTPRKKDSDSEADKVSLELDDLQDDSSYEEDTGSRTDADDVHQDNNDTQQDEVSYSDGSGSTYNSFASDDRDGHFEVADSTGSYEEEAHSANRETEDRPESQTSFDSYETVDSDGNDEENVATTEELYLDEELIERSDASQSFYSSGDDSEQDSWNKDNDASYSVGENDSRNENDDASYDDEDDNRSENDDAFYIDQNDDHINQDDGSYIDENDDHSGHESHGSQESPNEQEADLFDEFMVSESPTFNKRGGSKHSFKHPSVASGSFSGSDSNESGWESSEGMSDSENHDDPFQNEPKHNKSKRKKSKKPPKLPPFDDIESDDEDKSSVVSESDRQSEFQDEYPSKKDVKRKGKKNKKDRKMNGASDDIINNENNIEEYSTAPEGDSTRSNSKKWRGGTKSSQSSLMSSDLEHIVSREKLVVDRENTVNTRERKFTKWIIIASVLVLIGAIVLITLYFVNPGKKKNTDAPTLAPGFPKASAPSLAPVVAAPTPTIEPTQLPPNKIIVETSFLAFVPNGKNSGVTTEALEEDLEESLGIFLPPLLGVVLEGDDATSSRTRKNLRRLLPTTQDDIAVGESISVDVFEVDCPPGSPTSYLCVQVTTNIPLVNSSNDFTEAYASQLETAYAAAVTNAVDQGIVDLSSDVKLISYVDMTKSPIPTSVPVAATTKPSAQGTQLRGSQIPTMAPSEPSSKLENNPTESPTMFVTQMEGSQVPFASIDEDEEETKGPTESPTESPTISPTKEASSANDSPTAESTENVFCGDKNNSCRDETDSGDCERTNCEFWASENECSVNPDYMTVNCQKSCGLCGDFPPPPACSDKNERCVEWASLKECTNNPVYMELNCREACGLCSCENKNVDCVEDEQEDSSQPVNECVQSKCDLWTSLGECDSNPDYMNIYCRKSCNRCVDDTCEDDEDRCVGWAETGECSSNPVYMEQRCAKSCGVC